MEFTTLVLDILKTYPAENPKYADILVEQISGTLEFRNEVNGYGAYSHFTIQGRCRELPSHLANHYLPNKHFLHMQGRTHPLIFVLNTKTD